MISIDEIKTLVAFAELGSLTRASGRLHRTQPAISRRLGILEHELGAPMFEPVRGNVRLTEAGRVFLPYAETALAALKDGCEAVRGLQTGLQGTVSLARRRTHGSSTCARRTNNVRVELRTALSSKVTDLVRRAEATLGLRYFRADRGELVSSTLATSQCW